MSAFDDFLERSSKEKFEEYRKDLVSTRGNFSSGTLAEYMDVSRRARNASLFDDEEAATTPTLNKLFIRKVSRTEDYGFIFDIHGTEKAIDKISSGGSIKIYEDFKDNLLFEDESKKEMIIVHFEPWNFTDTNQLLTQFFVRLANEFQKKGDKNLTKIGKALENYSDAFGLFELLPGIGAPIAKVGKWGFSRLGQKIQKGLDERDVLKQKNQVIQLLSAQSNRVLVVLDDIDRLNKEQIRYIFQLITSVARFPNMTYLLVFDKEIVVEALKDVQSGNGQDYLEKVIQMPIQIPNIQRSDLHNFLFEQLDKIIIDFKDLGYNQKHWQQLFQSCVDPFITHLRDINRLCNALRFKLTGISSEIDFADMLAISILEIQHLLV